MRIFVTPRTGLKVRDPLNPSLGYLPEDGTFKEDSSAWRRLARAGDVTISEGPAAPAKTKPAAK